MPKKNRKRKAREVEEVEEVFSVEKIISKKVVNGKTQYLLKWRGYDSDQNTWEPEENLDCQDLLVEFNRMTSGPMAAKSSSKEEGGGSRAAMAGGSGGSGPVSSPVIHVSSPGAAVAAASVKITQEDKVGREKYKTSA